MQNVEDPKQKSVAWDGWEACSQKDAFMAHVGPIWQRPIDDRWEYAFEGRHILSNRNGSMHGGMIATFADYALGHTAWLAVEGQAISTIHLAVNFVAAAREGKIVRSTPVVVRQTRSLCFMQGFFFVDDTCIATADGIWKIART